MSNSGATHWHSHSRSPRTQVCTADALRICARLPFKTLLFDVDGTLIDSNGAHAESWTQALREHGVTVEVDHIRRMIGMGGDKILPAVAHVSEDSDAGKAIAGRKKQIFSTMLPGLQATHGARPLLEYLSERHIELIIATSAGDREMNALLQQAGVDDLIPSRATQKTMRPRRSPIRTSCMPRWRAPGRGPSRPC